MRIVDGKSTKAKWNGGEYVTDTKLLKQIIDESGLKKTFIAKQLGLSYQGYLRKENGSSEFKSSEIVIMKKLLRLPQSLVSEIFFAKSDDE